jgi:hypothetical protein
LGETLSPLADGVSIAAQFEGDVLVLGRVIGGAKQDQARAESLG